MLCNMSAIRLNVTSGLCIALSLAWLFLPSFAIAEQVRVNEIDAWVGKNGAVVLLPGAPVPLQGRIPIKAKWATDQELLVIEARPRPTGKDRVSLTLQSPQEIQRELLVWTPGANAPVRLMTLTGNDNIGNVMRVPNSDWYIIEKDAYAGTYLIANSRLSTVRQLENAEDSSIFFLKKSQTAWMVKEIKAETGDRVSIARFNPTSGQFDFNFSVLPEEAKASRFGILEHLGNLLIPLKRNGDGLNYLLFDPINNKVLGKFSYDDLEAQSDSQPKPETTLLDINTLEESLNGRTYPVVELRSYEGFETDGTTNDEAQSKISIKLPDASGGSMSYDQKFISFISNGVLIAREIVFVEKTASDQFQVEIEKAQLTTQAKQLGIGMIMYAGDNDDILPLAKDWQETVLTYLKNRSAFDNAEFLLPAKLLSDIEEPSRTPLARVDGKFGYVIIHADTSVRWFPKPRPNAKPD